MIPNNGIARSRWLLILASALVLLAGAGSFRCPRSLSAETRGLPAQTGVRAGLVVACSIDSSELDRTTDSFLETDRAGGSLAVRCRPVACGIVKNPTPGLSQGNPSLPFTAQAPSHPIPLLL